MTENALQTPSLLCDNTDWRVEVRSMEIQISDFENAAFVVFLILFTCTLLFFDLNLYIPIAKVDENIAMAQTRDAVFHRKFHIRKNPFLKPAEPPKPLRISQTTMNTHS